MDDDQQFCLRWNNHQSTLISVFDTLLENETLVDCTLAAEGKFLKAHKVVLSACSPYFATLLSEQYDKHPIFILKDVKYQELRAMMDYMYRGEVNISQDQLAALLKAAESLQIKGLSDNRTGSGNSSSGLGVGGSQQQQQQKISAEQQQHKHISVPGKLMTGSASAGYTLEQTKRSRIGPSSIDSQDLSGSREGSSSPTSRRRKKVRRRSIENVLADNHDNSNSSQVIQAGTSLVPTTNATGTITAMLPMVGSGVAGTTTTIAGTIASTVSAVTSSLQQQHQQQQTSAASAAANIITANVTKKTESVKMGGNTDAMNAAVTSIENIQDENAADSIDEKEMLMKEKQNHKRPKHHHEGGVVATSTGKDEIVIEPKSEYDDEGNDETVEDLTLDDEEMGLEDLDHNAGPSHGGEGSSQGYAQWQVDRSQDEVYMAAQEAQQRDPQDLRTLYNIATAAAAASSSSGGAGGAGIGGGCGSSGGIVNCSSASSGLFEPEISIRKLYKSCRKSSLPGSSPPSLAGLNSSAVSVGSGGGSHSGCGAGCTTCSLSAAAAASIQLANFIGSQMMLPTSVDISSISQNSSSGFGCISSKLPQPPPGGGGGGGSAGGGGGGIGHLTTHQSSTATSSSSAAHHAALIAAGTSSATTATNSSSSAISVLTTPKKNPTQFSCNFCQFVCSWKYDLKLHLRQKHGIHNKKL
ncbi:longitudinals lacking protein, isoforms H/M/V isoform X6 [Episyrphus balteatus]|uniref:longitudinals lacking protein, isoforms H/M/V isoform X6 n=1 Tax=Episyrphus balteatus TaxID=286459 RepID=UPI0024859407|nr:longitudinals lacking protein, isoforms H/M/V isoform X6 [Episyrphus balteatus]